jgi:hypothetical protein
MMAKTYTRDELRELLGDPEDFALIEHRWFNRGDGCAVYENADMGHPELGHLQFVSYGSSAAQLEMDEPPQRLPDIGNRINWRYQLIGVCRP